MTADKESEIARLEDKILAEGRKLRAVAEAEALKLRQSKIVEELKVIEEKLAHLGLAEKPSKKADEDKPAPAKKAASAAKSSSSTTEAKKS